MHESEALVINHVCKTSRMCLRQHYKWHISWYKNHREGRREFIPINVECLTMEAMSFSDNRQNVLLYIDLFKSINKIFISNCIFDHDFFMSFKDGMLNDKAHAGRHSRVGI